MHKGDQMISRRRSDKTVLRVVSGESDDIRRRHSKDNIMTVVARAFIGKATRIIPSVSVAPSTTDRKDLRGAEIRDSYLDYIWRKERLRLKWKRSVEMIPDRGIGLAQVWWDQDNGPVISVCENQDCGHIGKEQDIGSPCSLCMAKAQLDVMDQAMVAGSEQIRNGMQPTPPQQVDPEQAPKMVMAYEGDLKVSNVDPRDFMYDTSVTEIEDMTWCGIKRVLHVSKIRKRFPKQWGKISPEEGLYSDRYLHYSGSMDSAIMKTSWLKDHAVLYEIHESSSGEYPDGRIIYMCNERIMEIRPNIYYKLLNRFPFFAAARGDRRPDTFFGEPLGLQAEDLQKERNKLVDSMREHRELTVMPKVISPWGNGVDINKFNTTPGEHIRYSPQSIRPPEYLRGPEMPSYTPAEADRIKAAIREKYGVTEHDLGTSTGAQSGRYAAFVESQSADAISPMLLECYEEWVEMNRAILILGKHFTPPERLWTIQGSDKLLSHSWSEVDDRWGWDVVLSTEDSLSKNPMLRMQQANELWDRGILVDPSTRLPDVKRYMRIAALKLPGVGPDIEATERAYAVALPELIEKAMQNAEPPPQIRLYDNAKIMSEELLAWLQAHRMDPNQQLVAIVTQYWIQYSMALNPQDPTAMGYAPNPALQQQQPQQQQPAQTLGGGGTPGQMGGGQTNTASPESQPTTGSTQASLIQKADRSAETVARGQMSHEG
jgi:hypothetical protein